jgi:hypothetical protein
MLGVAYGRQASDPGAGEWNERLLDRMRQEVCRYQEVGCKVIIGGDMNAHYTKIGEEWAPSDRTGLALSNFCNGLGLTIVNHHKVCEGRWTRITARAKSTVDYFLVGGGAGALHPENVH